MTVAAVVLAAGGGSRFDASDGTHKLLADLRGKPVVAWAVEHAVDAGLDETIVVAGAADLAGVLPVAVTVVVNPAWETGQASSLQVALRAAAAAGHDAVVVGLGDQPFVPPSAWRAVAGAPADAAIVVASFDGDRRPPVRLASTVWGLLPVDGDEGARALMARRPDLVREVACEGEPADVDTQEDLDRWS